MGESWDGKVSRFSFGSSQKNVRVLLEGRCIMPPLVRSLTMSMSCMLVLPKGRFSWLWEQGLSSCVMVRSGSLLWMIMTFYFSAVSRRALRSGHGHEAALWCFVWL